MSAQIKDSRVSWIGDIPDNWTMRKISRSFSLIGSGTTPSVADSSFHEEGTIPWVNTGDLNDDIVTEPEKRLTEQAVQSHSTLRLYPPGTLLVAMYGATIGKIGILGIEACTNQACCALGESRFFDMRFAYYWFIDNRRNLVTLSYGGGQPNISQDLIRSLRIQAPTIPHQRRIAAFLDEQTANIDRLMEMRRRQMELLKEQRASLIQQAVTRGLNPDAPMKDSGIPWLGEIPEHWDLKRLKYIKSSQPNSLVDGPFGSNLKSIHFIEGGDVLVIESGHVTSGAFVTSEFKRITQEHFETIRRSECFAGDIVIAKIGANYGMSAILPELELPAVVSGNSMKLTVNSKMILTEFAHIQLLSMRAAGAFYGIVNLSAQPALSLGGMNELPLTLPSIKEQRDILDFIQCENAKFDTISDSYTRQLTLLAEYRAALIHECVTGQREVKLT
jgi:restriction endonuclease S subunit